MSRRCGVEPVSLQGIRIVGFYKRRCLRGNEGRRRGCKVLGIPVLQLRCSKSNFYDIHGIDTGRTVRRLARKKRVCQGTSSHQVKPVMIPFRR